MEVKINRERDYHVKLMKEGKIMLEIYFRATKKTQKKGLLGLDRTVIEEFEVSALSFIASDEFRDHGCKREEA